jgi:hypothetical protein
MGDGAKFALALILFLLAFIAFFFAFHPGGVEGVSDPDTMLNWLFGEYQAAATGNAGSDVAATNNASVGPNNAGSAPTQTGALWLAKLCNHRAFLFPRNCQDPMHRNNQRRLAARARNRRRQVIAQADVLQQAIRANHEAQGLGQFEIMVQPVSRIGRLAASECLRRNSSRRWRS